MARKKAVSFASYVSLWKCKLAGAPSSQANAGMDIDTESNSTAVEKIGNHQNDQAISKLDRKATVSPEGDVNQGSTIQPVSGTALKKPKARSQGRKPGYRYRCWLCDFNRNSKHEISRHFKRGAHPDVKYDMNLIQEYAVEESTEGQNQQTAVTPKTKSAAPQEAEQVDRSCTPSGANLRPRSRRSLSSAGTCSEHLGVHEKARHKENNTTGGPAEHDMPAVDSPPPPAWPKHKRGPEPNTTRVLRSHKRQKTSIEHQPE